MFRNLLGSNRVNPESTPTEIRKPVEQLIQQLSILIQHINNCAGQLKDLSNEVDLVPMLSAWITHLNDVIISTPTENQDQAVVFSGTATDYRTSTNYDIYNVLYNIATQITNNAGKARQGNRDPKCHANRELLGLINSILDIRAASYSRVYPTVPSHIHRTAWGPSTGGAQKSKRKPFEKCTVQELKEKAKKRKIKGYSNMAKPQLISVLRDNKK